MPIQDKPSRNEDEYFAKQDAELMRERRAKLDADRTNSERLGHYMKCPKCGGDLAERDYHHVMVDVCSSCGGMWLDKGEVETLTHVDRSAARRFVGSLFGLK